MQPSHLLRLCALLILLLTIAPASFAQVLYWDTSGSGANRQSWRTTDPWWSTSPTGGNTQAWVQGSTAVFSAANTFDPGNYSLVDVGPGINVPSIQVQSGQFDLWGGSYSGSSFVNLSSFYVAAGALAILDTALTESGGPVNFTKTGAGTLNLVTTAISTTGSTTVSGGTLNINSVANLSSGNITVNNGATLAATGELRFNSRAVTVTGVGSTATTGTFIEVGHSTNGSLTIENGGSVFSTTTTAFGVFGGVTGTGLVTGNGSTLTVGTDLLLGYQGTGNLTVSNDGRVQIDRHAYLGHSGGVGNLTLASGGTLAIGRTDGIRFGSGTGTLTLSGGTIEVFDSNLTTSVPATLTSGTLSTINTNGLTATLTGLLSGAGGLVKTGAGVLTLPNANTYTGGTVINGGTLTMGHINSLGPNGSHVTLNGGTLDLGTFSPTFGTVIFDGGTFTNGSVINAAAFEVRTGSLANSLGGAAALTKTGAGTFTLTGSNTYTGGTFVNDGILNLGHATNTLPDTGAVTIAGGTLNLGTHSDTVGAVTLSSGSITGSGTLFATSFNLSGPVTISTNLGGPATLTRSGSGTTTLSGNNTYTGGTHILGGTLQISADANLGAEPASPTPGNITLDGGTLATTATFTLAPNRGIALGSSGGTIETADATMLTYEGSIAGSGSLTKSGGGTLLLSGSNNYAGNTTIAAGTLIFGSPQSLYNGVTADWSKLTVANGAQAAIDLRNPGFGSSEVSALINNANFASGTRALEFYFPDHHSLTQTIELDLSSAAPAALSISGTTPLKLDGNSLTLDLAANQALTVDRLFAGGSDGATGAFPGNAHAVPGGVGGSGTAAGNFTASGGTLSWAQTVMLSGGTGGTGGQGSNGIFTSNNIAGGPGGAGGIGGSGGNMTLSGETVSFAQTVNLAGGVGGVGGIGGNSGGTRSAPTGGDGGDGGDGGSFTFSGNTLSFEQTVNLAGGDGGLGGDGGFATSQYAGDGGKGGSGGLGGNLTLANGSVTFAQAVTLAGGDGGQGGNAQYLNGLRGSGGDGGDGGSLTISGGNVNFATGASLNLAGGSGGSVGTGHPAGGPEGSAGANGTFTLSGGTLQLPSLGWLENTDTFIGNFAFTGGTFQTTDAGESLALDGTSQFGQALANPGVTANRTLDLAGNLNFSGVIAGSGSLTKAGTGTLTLSGANTYTGDTIISAGALVLGDLNALQNSTLLTTTGLSFGSVTAANFGGLSSSQNLALTNASAGPVALSVGNNNASTTFSGILSGAGSLTKTGDGTLTLTGANTYSGGTTIDGGTLRLGAGGNSGSITGTIVNNGTLAFNRSGDYTFGGVISGTGGLVNEGSILRLSAQQTYTGPTTINSGILVLPDTVDNGLSASTAVHLSGGAQLDLSNRPQTFSGLTGEGTVYSFPAAGGSGGHLTLNIAGDQTFAGTLGGAHPNFGLTKTGPGALTLSGSNNYSGVTTLSEGILRLGSTTALAGTSAVTLASGTTLDLDGNSVTLAALDGAGSIALGSATLTTGNANNHSLSGDISGTGSLAKTGNGTLTLTGTNTYSGGTTVSGGTLIGNTASLQGDILNNAAVIFDQASAGTYAGILSGSGSLTKSGEGSLTLGSANTFTGGTTISNGTLRLGHADALQNSTLTTVTGLSFGNLTAVHLGGLSGSGNLALVNESSAAVALSIGNNNSNTTYSGSFSGIGSLTKSGTGTLTLDSANTFTGDTTISNGTLRLGHANALQNSTLTTVTGLSFGNLTAVNLGGLSGSGNLALVNESSAAVALSIGNNNSDTTYSGSFSGDGSLTKSGSGNLTLTGTNTYTGGTTVSAGSLTGTVNSIQGDVLNNALVIFEQGGDGSFSGNMSGVGNLIMSGEGSLTLDSANTFTGDTTISNGTLRLGHTDALQNSTLTTVTGLSFGNLTAVHLGGLSGSGNLALVNESSAAVALSIGNNHSNTTYSGSFSGIGSLTKSGSGTLTLTGTNSYTGGTTISNGTLVGNTASLQGNIVNNAALVFDQASAGTYAGILSGTGSLAMTGVGTLILTGTNTYTGGTTINSGTLQLGNGGSTGSLVGNVTNNGTFIFNRGDNFTFAGAIDGSGSVTKSGSGALTLTGTNTYSGGTTVSSGSLVGNTASLQGHIVNNAALIFDQASTGTYAGNLSGTGSLAKTGAGTVILTGANTHTGGTNISSGTLQLGNGGSTGSLVGSVTNNGTIIFNRGDNFRFDGIIDGPGEVVHDGYILRFSQPQTYTGPTTINSGFLVLPESHDYGLSASTVVNLAAGATLDLSHRPQTIAGLNGGGTVYSFPVTGNSGGPLTLDLAEAQTHTFSGTLGGAFPNFALIKEGEGTQILTGTNTYSGGTTISSGTLQLGDGGSNGSIVGNVTNNGTLIFNRNVDFTFGGTIDGTGEVIHNGYILRLSEAQTYTGPTTINSGFFALSGSHDYGLSASTVVNLAAGATLDLSHRPQAIAGLNGSGTVYSFPVSGSPGGPLTLDLAEGQTHTFSGTLGGAFPNFALIKEGEGTQILSGANSYTGGTTINQGTLHISNGLLSAGGEVRVEQNGTLVSSGTIVRNVLNNGSIVTIGETPLTLTGGVSGSGHFAGNFIFDGTTNPGQSPGLMQIDGNLTFGSNHFVQLEIAGLARGIEYDAFDISGSLNLDGSLELVFLDAFAPQAGDSFLFFQVGESINGLFSNLILPDLTDQGLLWDFSAFNATGSIGVSAVPEPSTYALIFGLSILGVVFWRRKRNAQCATEA